MILWKCCIQYVKNLENSSVAKGLEKVSLHSNPMKSNAKECSNYCIIPFISHASKIMLKTLQARLQQYVNCELQDVQYGFRKSRVTRYQIANIHWFIEKSKRIPGKHLLLLYWLCQVFVWITTNCGKFFKRWEYQTTKPASWEICM